eukprot:gene42027-56899_t
MKQALAQAKDGRHHILGEMAKAMEAPRAELGEFAPKIETIKIPVDKIREVIGLAAYGLADLRLLSRYRRLLANQRSDDQRFAARWLSRASAATLLLLPIWATYALWDWWQPIGYRGLMGLYVAIAAETLNGMPDISRPSTPPKMAIGITLMASSMSATEPKLNHSSTAISARLIEEASDEIDGLIGSAPESLSNSPSKLALASRCAFLAASCCCRLGVWIALPNWP